MEIEVNKEVFDPEGYRSDRERDDLYKILFAGALEGGVREISWEDMPKVTAALTRAGLVVRGEFQDNGDFGRNDVAVISVEFKLRVKDIRRKPI